MMDYGFHSMNVLAMLGMVIFWVLVVASGIWLLRRLFPESAHTVSSYPGTQYRAPVDRVLEILRERYTRGEITRAEYDEIRHTLEV